MTTLHIHDIHRPRAEATSIIGPVTLQCEIVYRCEGWVPRYTLRETMTGALLGGDTRFKHEAACRLLASEAGIDLRTAGAIVCHVADTAEGLL